MDVHTGVATAMLANLGAESIKARGSAQALGRLRVARQRCDTVGAAVHTKSTALISKHQFQQRGKLLWLREGISIQRGRLAQEVTLRLAGALDQGAERLELLAIRWNDAKLHVDQRKFMVVLEPAASGPVRPGSGKKKMPYVVDSMNDPDGTSFKCKNGKYAILGPSPHVSMIFHADPCSCRPCRCPCRHCLHRRCLGET